MDRVHKNIYCPACDSKPLGVIPIFVSLTRGSTVQERQTYRRTTSITVAVVLFASALVGSLCFNFFGVSIDSFQGCGGILCC